MSQYIGTQGGLQVCNTFNSEIHDINTRHNHNLHLPSTNLTLVQKVVLFSGIKFTTTYH